MKLTMALLTLAAPLLSQTYDIVLANGRAMDPESNLDAVRQVCRDRPIDGGNAQSARASASALSILFLESPLLAVPGGHPQSVLILALRITRP